MGTSLNRRWFNVASAPGSGDVACGSALAGFLGLGSAQDGMTFDGVTFLDGSAWEVRNGCVYTHSTTTLTRGTLEESSTGSAISLSSSATVMLSVSADAIRRFESAALNHVAGADANTTMAVGALYVVDGSTLTADRTYTLPAVAAVGDRIGVMMSAGSASYEVLLTAASGDTLNAVAGGMEWSRLFITGEVVIMRCVTANATWVVEQDHRIAQAAKMYLSTSADGETASTYTRPTAAPTPGAWTSEFDNANILGTASDRITPRRAGRYSVVVAYAPKDAGTAGQFGNLEIRRNGSIVIGGPSATLTGAFGVNRITAAMLTTMSVGDYLDYWYRTGDGNIGANGSISWICTFAMLEVFGT